MITSLSWVPKGASKPIPCVADPPSKEEIEEMKKKLVLLEIGKDVESELGGEDSGDMIADGLDELNMDEYDNEEDAIDILCKGIGDTFYPSNELDPYLKDTNDGSEEVEDVVITSEDGVVVCARTGDDDVDTSNRLLFYIIEDPHGDYNPFVRHHIDLSDFPLCTAWLDCPIRGGEKGNFMAVGMMGPEIEIWDLDMVDESLPALTLGGFVEKKKLKKGKKVEKSIKYKKDSHTGPVLALAWNKGYRNILASGSADKTVKIWDVATGKCKITMEHHTDKVQAVAWNNNEREVLLSGSFDRTVVMRDGRVPSHSGFKWSVGADVESLAWDPHDQHLFVASLENGTVVGFDIRTATSNPTTELKPKFTLHAHVKNVCAISYNPLVPNLLATGSQDKTVKLWDLSNNQPSCVASQDCKAEDCPFLLAVAGYRGNLKLWDILSDAGISRRYGKYARQNSASV